MALALAQRTTAKELLDYAVKGVTGAKKVCPAAVLRYANAANTISAKLQTANVYDIKNMRNMLKGADNFCTANRLKTSTGTPAGGSTPPAQLPSLPGTGALSFMNKLPGPKWAWFTGAGLLGAALIFPAQTKGLLKKVGL